VVDDRAVADRFDDTRAVVSLADKTRCLPFDGRRAGMRARLVAQAMRLYSERESLLASLNSGYEWLERNEAHNASAAFVARYEAWQAMLVRYEAICAALQLAEGEPFWLATTTTCA